MIYHQTMGALCSQIKSPLRVTNRSVALESLHAFLPQVPRYGVERNFDRPGHAEVSRLSPWIRYRVLSEEECVRAVLSAHPFSVAAKFVQELMWRTYWKGWLELRPGVWASYLAQLESLKVERANCSRYLSATRGQTGLSFFDDWVSELVTTGYLHNHTRMWFASVWIFTLQLPWQLGAEFMYRHLLDGDPASNTLSWRWVGGLQTKGKIYVARPDNIAKYSEGRWSPKDSELNLHPEPLPEDGIDGAKPLHALPSPPQASLRCVLVHDDDLSVDLYLKDAMDGIRYFVLKIDLSSRADTVMGLVQQLRNDFVARTRGVMVIGVEDVARCMQDAGERVMYATLPRCGEELPVVMRLREDLHERGIDLVFFRREWDERYFPLAKSGYFPFWSSVKEELRK